MPYLIKVTKKVIMQEPNSSIAITSKRPHVLQNEGFVKNRLVIGDIELIDANLSEFATDTEFAKHWKEFKLSKTQEASAVESFLSMYGTPEDIEIPPEPVKEEVVILSTPKKRSKRKKK